MDKSLQGLRVLVTRPAHQAEPLCQLIEQAGGHALRQPLLSIKPPQNPEQALQGLESPADIAVFTSTNAVVWAHKLQPDWAPPLDIYAVGRATARSVRCIYQREAKLPARDFTSEGLLALPGLSQLQGRRINLITGEQGRPHLPQTMRERGAKVDILEVYRRELFNVARGRLQALLQEADAVFVSSGEMLDHLYKLVTRADRPTLLAAQLVVPSSRVLKLAHELGFTYQPLQPARMQDGAVLATLIEWVNRSDGRPTSWGNRN